MLHVGNEQLGNLSFQVLHSRHQDFDELNDQLDVLIVHLLLNELAISSGVCTNQALIQLYCKLLLDKEGLNRRNMGKREPEPQFLIDPGRVF